MTNEPLMGTGPLPNWLRNLAHSRQMFALDTYRDNLCLWRCLAVYQGARPDHCIAAARRLTEAYFKKPCPDCPRTALFELDKVEHFLNQNKPVKDWTGFRVVEPVKNDKRDFIVWQLIRQSPATVQNIVNLGVFEGHAFLIKNLDRISKFYACQHCHARFTKMDHLH